MKVYEMYTAYDSSVKIKTFNKNQKNPLEIIAVAMDDKPRSIKVYHYNKDKLIAKTHMLSHYASNNVQLDLNTYGLLFSVLLCRDYISYTFNRYESK